MGRPSENFMLSWAAHKRWRDRCVDISPPSLIELSSLPKTIYTNSFGDALLDWDDAYRWEKDPTMQVRLEIIQLATRTIYANEFRDVVPDWDFAYRGIDHMVGGRESRPSEASGSSSEWVEDLHELSKHTPISKIPTCKLRRTEAGVKLIHFIGSGSLDGSQEVLKRRIWQPLVGEGCAALLSERSHPASNPGADNQPVHYQAPSGIYSPEMQAYGHKWISTCSLFTHVCKHRQEHWTVRKISGDSYLQR